MLGAGRMTATARADIGAPRFGLLLDAPTTITDWTVPNLR